MIVEHKLFKIDSLQPRFLLKFFNTLSPLWNVQETFYSLNLHEYNKTIVTWTQK